MINHDFIYEQGPVNTDEKPLRIYRKMNANWPEEKLVEVAQDVNYPPFVIDIADHGYEDDDIYRPYVNDIFRQISKYEVNAHLFYDDSKEDSVDNIDAETFVRHVDKNSENVIPSQYGVDGKEGYIQLNLSSYVTYTHYDSYQEDGDSEPHEETAEGMLDIAIHIEFDENGKRTTDLEAYGNIVVIRNAYVMVSSGWRNAQSDYFPEDSNYLEARIRNAHYDLKTNTLTVISWANEYSNEWDNDETLAVSTGISPVITAINAIYRRQSHIYKQDNDPEGEK